MSSTEPARRSAKNAAALRHQHQGQQQQQQQQQQALGMDPPSHAPTPAAKVAIPPLRPRLDPAPPPPAAEKRRTPKACVECRTRKIKCNGRRPTCEHCEQCQIPCVYAEGKREQNKRATERSDRLLQLLGDISREVSLPPHLQQKIRAFESESTQILEDNTSVRSLQTTASKRRRKSSASGAPEKLPRSSSPTLQGEADVSADVGSEESVDIVEEDFNRSEKARATGFIGKNSEVAWARRLAQAQHGGLENDVRGNSYGRPGNSEEAQRDRLSARKERHAAETQQHPPISDFTYHLDTENVLTFDHVDKDELPPPQVAQHLLDHYMETVQDALPILSKSVFLDQYRRYSRAKSPESLPATWRAILNMVFAIGAKFSHLVNAPWRGDERDHLVYYTRALNLGMPGDAMVAHPDLQRIQVLGLVSFYYLTISQVSRYVNCVDLMRRPPGSASYTASFVKSDTLLHRSWVMIGLACRQAVALGLHLRNLDPQKDAGSKEKRIRVWWSLYYIENLLCEILGRPTAIDQRFCSTPAPAPIDEANSVKIQGKQMEEWSRSQSEALSTPASEDRKAALNLESAPNPATHFRSRVKLAVISQKIMVNLYSATTVQKSWEGAQDEIIALSTELDEWYKGLPTEFQFAHSEDKNAFCREKILLGFGFFSTKILLNRPCLCRIDKRIRKQGTGSKNIDQEHAQECVMAARSMSDLLPDMDVPDVNWMYHNGPWWCIVHHLMQAMTVLMLELAFEMFHMSDLSVDQEAIVQTARKLLRWLTMMAANGNESAKSACKQAEEQFKGFSPFEHIDISDLVEMAERGSEPASEHLSKERRDSVSHMPDRMQQSTRGSSAQVSGNPVSKTEVWDGTKWPSSKLALKQARDRIMVDTFQDQPMEDLARSHLPNHVTSQNEQEESWPHYTDEELWSTDWTAPADSTWSTGVFHNMYDLSNPFMAFGNPLAPPFPFGTTLGSDGSAAFSSQQQGVSQTNAPHGTYEYEVAMAESQQHQPQQQQQQQHFYQFSPSTQDQRQQHFAQPVGQQPHFQPPSTNEQWQQNPQHDH